MANVIVVIDEQNDFITGSLGSQEAVDAVEKTKNLLRYVSQDKSRKWEFIFTRDTHFRDFKSTREGSMFPEHCISGTDGWKLSGELSEFTKTGNDGNVFNKFGFGSLAICHKAFCSAHCEDDVIFVGLCTDICVIANVLMFTSLFPNTNVKVVANCCAGTTKEKHEAALAVMRSCGVEIINM